MPFFADVAELADALGSGPSGSKIPWRFESSHPHVAQPGFSKTRAVCFAGMLSILPVCEPTWSNADSLTVIHSGLIRLRVCRTGEQERLAMGLIYCGIDEAGYGPMLGPLCVGFAAIGITRWQPGDGHPDLWAALGPSVSRTKPRAARAGTTIPIADSKKLKLPNSSTTRHPLTYLEQGVLAFASLLKASDHERFHASDESLFNALGVHLDNHPCYRGEPVELPLGTTTARLAIMANRLALACQNASIEPLAMACVAVPEQAFNEAIVKGHSKAHLTAWCFARLLRRAFDRWHGSGDAVRFVCDRHSGRTNYQDMIATALNTNSRRVEVTVLEESHRCSRYAITTPDSGASYASAHNTPEHGFVIHFLPEAEDAHFPVALASMTAKFIRELAMARFNRYWCARCPQLKPTAGYVQDARRWLNDAAETMTSEDRNTLVRLA